MDRRGLAGIAALAALLAGGEGTAIALSVERVDGTVEFVRLIRRGR